MTHEKRSPAELLADIELLIDKRQLSLEALKLHSANRVAEAVVKSGGITDSRDVFSFALGGADKHLQGYLQRLEWKYREAQGKPIAKFFKQDPKYSALPGELHAVGMMPEATAEGGPSVVYRIKKLEHDYTELPCYEGTVSVPIRGGRMVEDWSHISRRFKELEPISSLDVSRIVRPAITLEYRSPEIHDDKWVIGWQDIFAARDMGHDQATDAAFLNYMGQLRQEFSVSE